MKQVIFLDIDTQYDFMHKEGKFYIPDAEKIVPNLERITNFVKKKKIFVIASIDNHKVSNANINPKTSFKHYAAYDSGQKKIPETWLKNAVSVPNKKLDDRKIEQLKEKNRLIIEKQKHDVFSNPNTKKILRNVKKAYVYGVATDYCIKAAVLGLRNMNIETYVIKDAIKPVFKKNEKKDLALFRKKGAKFLNTKQLLKKNSL